MEGRLAPGMNALEVEQVRGTPTRINVTTGVGGRSEQWVYERRNGQSEYLYMDNGVLRSPR